MCINAYDIRPGDLSLALEEKKPASDIIGQGVLMSLDTSTTEPSASARTTGGLAWWDWGRVGLGRNPHPLAGSLWRQPVLRRLGRRVRATT
jgi:hypothetical protein